MSDAPEECPDATESPGLATSRSRRDKGKKVTNRLAALATLKAARDSGRKHLAEVDDFKPVYDEVDIDEYSELVSNRRNDDWIVDDDGMYVEDGREIFDEEMGDEDDGHLSSKGSKKDSKATKIKPKKGINSASIAEETSSSTAGRSIKSMFQQQQQSKKKKNESSDMKEDELLGELLGEIKSSGAAKKNTDQARLPKLGGNIKPVVAASGPVNPFRSTGIKRPKRPLATNDSQNVEDFDVKEFDEDVPSPGKPTQTIDDFPDFDDAELMQIDEVATQEIEKEKENRTKMESEIEKFPQHRGFEEKKSSKESSDLNSWSKDGMTSFGNVKEETPDIQVDSESLPLVENDSGEKVLRMYWLDAYEDPFKHPGTVWLFGKVFIESAKAFVSCCLTVKNIDRRIFLLKRDVRFDPKRNTPISPETEVSIGDVYTEFDQKIANRYKIPEYRSKPSRMNYAFEIHDVPNIADYLEVIYSSKHPALPSDLKGETFSHIFGANQSSLEQFLLSRKFKGPSWIEVRGAMPSNPAVSWCKVEAICEKPIFVSVISQGSMPSPPVTILALNMKTVVNPKTHQNEITLVSGLVHQEFYLDRSAPKPAFRSHFCAITRPSDEIWPFDFAKVLQQQNSSSHIKVEKIESERGLLAFLMAKVGKLDPDIIIGHDVTGFDLDVLLHRMVINKIPNWSRLGRLKRSQPPYAKGRNAERQATTGRLVCDLKISAKELIRCKSYELGALIEKLLGKPLEKRLEVDCDVMKQAYNSSKSLVTIIGLGLQDCADMLQCICDLNALPLALQITQVAGNVMSRTLLGGRAERNEFLLLHAFHEKGFIVPDKIYGKRKTGDDEGEPEGGKTSGKRKPAYAGGLVLEPKKGFYDTFILLMDFNSLYPSIIQEYNICFTTVSRKKPEGVKEEEYIPELPTSDAEQGVLPTEICKLVESRRAVKSLLKDPNLSDDQRMQYDIRQMALKLTANSMYGCLGFSFSRFFAKPIAALVTSRGREILLQTKDLVEKMNLEVIYGDTDSIMINSNSTDYGAVFKLGAQIKAAVNKTYRLLELDIDGVFKYMLLLKKKKYAAVTMEKKANGELVTNIELKGLDIVRRDWCQLASDSGKEILSKILSDCSADDRISHIHSQLEKLAEDLKAGKIPLASLAITKQLTKEPEDYADKKSLPHVQVAMRVNTKGGKRLRAGDTVQYVICDDGSGLPATQRAFHVDEVKENKDLKVDINYYLAQQLHPVVSRLCDPLEGTDSARIAQCLGLDPDQYRRSIRSEMSQEEETGLKDEDRFRQCEKFKFECLCGEVNILDNPVRGSGRDVHFALTKCSNLSCKLVPIDRFVYLQNKIVLNIRRFIKKYYEGWIICEDPGCTGRTRQLPLTFQRAFPICSTCHKATMYREYNDSQLYLQMLYYQHLFQVHKEMNKHPSLKDGLSDAWLMGYQILRNTVDKLMNQNKYSIVSLNKVFEGLFPVNPAKFRGHHQMSKK